MTKYTDCELCGREIGHWLGCEGATQLPPGSVDLSEDLRQLIQPMPAETPTAAETDDPAEADASTPPETCEHGECPNDKRPQGKGPRPKYCDDHREQKNRK